MVVMVLVPVVVLLVMAWQYRWIGDDGFINFRVVQQIRAGNGPVFNRGERVEAGTSPLWIAILTVVDLLTPFRLEWIAVVLGIAMSVGGLAFALAGTSRLTRRATGVPLPLGAIVLVALPPTWIYATAGLEGGLSLLWLGCSWWLLARGPLDLDAARQERPDRPWITPMVLGLGPLVRPDFLAISLVFLVALLWLARAGGWRARVLALTWAAVLPVAAEIFRMGYYGLLVPNTALAKEASSSYWQQGWYYLTDFVSTYQVLVPLVLLALLVIVDPTARPLGRHRVLAIAASVAALVSVLYWVRVGGDWMHARVLMPALMCALLPVMFVVVRSWRWIGCALVATWALWCGVGMRPTGAMHHGIVNPRWVVAHLAKGRSAITIDDWLKITPLPTLDRLEQQRRRAGQTSGLWLNQAPEDAVVVPVRPDNGPGARTVVRAITLGMFSYAVGPDVYVADALTLADPVGSHIDLRHRGRPGHEKILPSVWLVARFARDGAVLPSVVIDAFPARIANITPAAIADARAALSCGDLRDLMDAVNKPLTVGRFVDNLLGAPGRTTLRFSPDPAKARRQLCAGSP
jgi:arabinofuranosyltransferase